MDVNLVVVILNVRIKYCPPNIAFKFIQGDLYLWSPRLSLLFFSLSFYQHVLSLFSTLFHIFFPCFPPQNALFIPVLKVHSLFTSTVHPNGKLNMYIPLPDASPCTPCILPSPFLRESCSPQGTY